VAAVTLNLLTISSTGHLTRAGVHAKFETFRVQLIRYGPHAVGELSLIRSNIAIFASDVLPAVVQDNVIVSHISQPEIYELLGCAEKQIF
jgi:hypothetical protein